MKKLKIIKRVMRRTKADMVIGIFVAFVFVDALLIYLVEPSITNYGDSLWYCYVNLFTIGFGDIVPTTVVGRILSVILTVYATLVIAVVTGVIVAVYREVLRYKRNEDKDDISYKLSNLDKLSKEELGELSEKIKELQK